MVSISNLTNTRQWDKEPVMDYNNHWRALSLKFKDHLLESSIEMGAHRMVWEILYALEVSKPKTFQELVAQPHDMELTIAYYRRRLNKDESMTSSKNESSMLRGSEEKECPCSEADVPEMLDKLLKKELMELSAESRCPKEIRRINDSKYCKYHGIISHLIEKCKGFKRQVLSSQRKERSH